jgi:hypothetical protein
MTQVTPINDEFRLKVYSLSLDKPNICDLSNEFMMYPYKLERTAGGEIEFVYKVTDGGSTLRDFITKLHTTKSKKRISFRKENTINPPDLLMQMIDVYDVLLSTNKITNQSFINPDLIWITTEHRIKVIYTWDMDLITDRNLKLYWSPELLGKHTQLMYANIDAGIHKQQVLKRYDTRPSTMSCVYSLGLVFYFMITGDDPYEGHRIHVYDRPDMTMMNPIYGQLIWSATHSDVKQRPTMKEWSEMVKETKGTKWNNCILL